MKCAKSRNRYRSASSSTVVDRQRVVVAARDLEQRAGPHGALDVDVQLDLGERRRHSSPRSTVTAPARRRTRSPASSTSIVAPRAETWRARNV